MNITVCQVFKTDNFLVCMFLYLECIPWFTKQVFILNPNTGKYQPEKKFVFRYFWGSVIFAETDWVQKQNQSVLANTLTKKFAEIWLFCIVKLYIKHGINHKCWLLQVKGILNKCVRANWTYKSKFLVNDSNYKKLSKKNQPINGSLLGDWILWMKCIYDASISIEMHRCIHFNFYFTKTRKKFEKLMKLIVKQKKFSIHISS